MPPATTDDAGNGAPDDPTLSVLVPKPSRLRNLMFVALAVLALVAVGLSPKVLKPSVAAGASGSATTDRTSRIIVTAMETSGETLPWLEIASVDPVDGATIEGAWLVPDGAVDRRASVARERSDDPQALAEAQLPGVRLEDYALPQRLRSDERAVLVVVWRVTDCRTLDNRSEMTVQARSLIGIRSTMTAPMFDGGLDSLARNGICPKRARARR